MFQIISMVLIAVLIRLIFRFIRSPVAVYTTNRCLYRRRAFPRVDADATERHIVHVPQFRLSIGEGDLVVLRVILALYRQIATILEGDAPPTAQANMVRRYVYGVLATLDMRGTSWAITWFTTPAQIMVDAYSRQRGNMTEHKLACFLTALKKTSRSMLKELLLGEKEGLWPSATKVFHLLPVSLPTTGGGINTSGGHKAPVAIGVAHVPLRRPTTQINPRICHVQWSSAICISD